MFYEDGTARVEFMKVYAVYDTNDKGCNQSTLAYFSMKTKAEEYSVGRGRIGGKGNVLEHQAVKINDQVFLLQRKNPIRLDFTKEDQKRIKEEAIKKISKYLNDDELNALGVKDNQ